MNFLDRVKQAPSNMLPMRIGYGVDGHGVMGFAVDKGERYAAAWAFGAAKGYWREKAVWKGAGMDLWLGGALTLVSAGLQVFSYGRSRVAPHLERLGDAGIMSYLNSVGAAWGNKKAGRIVQVIEGGRTLPSLPVHSGVIGEQDAIGAIPPAMGGSYLTAEEIAAYSEQRA